MKSIHSFVLFCLLLVVLTGCQPRHERSGDPLVTRIHMINRNGTTETISHPDQLKKHQKTNFLSEQPYRKVLRVFRKNEEDKTPSVLTSYHTNGSVAQYLEATNSRAFGVYLEWYSNGIKKIEARVVEGVADLTATAQNTWIFDGASHVWDLNGHLKAEIQYSRGVLDGTSKYYTKKGTLSKIISYRGGKPCGDIQAFFEDGSVKSLTTYVEGRKAGSAYSYWPSGKRASEEMYDNGLLMEGIYLSQSGNTLSLIKEGNGKKAIFKEESLFALHTYLNGKEKGEAREFTPKGNLFRRYILEEGKKIGEEVEYYTEPSTSPQPKLSIYWQEGEVSGEVRTWYSTGQLESSREFNANRRQGLHTAWYGNGAVMLIEDYDQDKLKSGKYFVKNNKKLISQVVEGKGTVTVFDKNGHFRARTSYEEGAPIR